MNQRSENQVFEYTYSASRQEEVEAIRKKYLPESAPTTQDKLKELRALDQKVTGIATAWALVCGVLSALILGLGMSLVIVWAQILFGILIGVCGIAGVIVTYPLYHYILKKEREKAAPRILKLTEDLSQEA